MEAQHGFKTFADSKMVVIRYTKPADMPSGHLFEVLGYTTQGSTWELGI